MVTGNLKQSTTYTTFEELDLYKVARHFRVEIYRVAKTLPEEERYGVASQMRRAAVSVTSNIAEGHGRFHYQENIQFLRQARGSLQELIDDVNVCSDEHYLDQERAVVLKEEAYQLLKQLNGYLKYLRRCKSGEEESFSPQLPMSNYQLPESPITNHQLPVTGFTLIELLIGAATLAIAIVALLGAFFGQITLNEHARNMTWAINDANRVMERLRQVNTNPCAGGGNAPSTAVPVECNPGGTSGCGVVEPWNVWLTDNGGKSIQPDPANNELIVVRQTGGADPITITVAVCWRHRGRILGECIANDAALQASDTGVNGFTAGDGIIGSPAMLTTLMTCRS